MTKKMPRPRTDWWKNQGRIQCIFCQRWMDKDDPELVTKKVIVGESLIGEMTAPPRWEFCCACWYEFQRVVFANGSTNKASAIIALPRRGQLQQNREYS